MVKLNQNFDINIMPNFTKKTNISRYFFWKLLDMFFPIKMTVYENSQVLNTLATTKNGYATGHN